MIRDIFSMLPIWALALGLGLTAGKVLGHTSHIESLEKKIYQLEERIMRVEVMVARGDKRCGG